MGDRIRVARIATVCVCAVIVLGLQPANGAVLPFGLKIEKVLDNEVELGDLAVSPTGEFWLLERATGTVKVLVGGVEAASLTLPVRNTCDSGLLDVAFASDYPRSGEALVSYVDAAGRLRVDRIIRRKTMLQHGPTILDLGVTAGCRPGGGLVNGLDGTAYVGVGDLEFSGNGQDDGSLAGKVLRFALDGSVPADNPDPTSLVYGKGFRNVAGLAINASGSRANGTLYGNDLGMSGSVADEINVIVAEGNYGWDILSGDSGGTFDDPIVSQPESFDPRSIAVLERSALGGEFDNDLVYASPALDELGRLTLGGADFDTLVATSTFFDPDGDPDGTPDTGCPRQINVVTPGTDGMLYAGNHSNNAGIWRIYRDEPGPREVSPRGSPFFMTLGKQAGNLRLAWEKLDPLDAGRPARHAGQDARPYQIWEGTLPIAGSYDHALIAHTDGVPDGPARQSDSIAPGVGSHYYLVSAQGDNLQGSTGHATIGTPREDEQDHCATIGYGKFTGQCIDDFRHPTTGQTMKLIDYNPLSPTYQQALSVRDFRGKVVHLDIAAFDCFWCNLQAPTFPEVDQSFRGRDFILLTVLNASEFAPRPYGSPEACAAGIQDWVDQHGEQTPVLCDVDLDGNGLGDVSTQLWHDAIDDEPCGGFSQNIFVDQGGVIFNFGCSFTPGTEVTTIIAPEINPERCE
jgi:hypothetical protein